LSLMMMMMILGTRSGMKDESEKEVQKAKAVGCRI